MTPKDYLKQAYRLDKKINSQISELEELKQLVKCVPSIQYGERVQTMKSTEAPFVKQLEKMWLLEKKINKQIDKFVNLKEQMRMVIDEVEQADEHLVLRYRYIHGMTWEAIASELNADVRTVQRWHTKAIGKVKVPEKPILV